MIQDGGTIEFESRNEVDEVEQALKAYIEEHPTKATESVKKLQAMLEALWYSW